jgi:hypothetical protein
MFKLRQDVYGVQTRSAVLNNSLTVKIGDVIAPLASGSAVTNATATVAGDVYDLGVVVGFTTKTGGVISTGNDPANTPSQLITASDNLTVDMYRAVYVPLSPEMEFSATLDAVAGTTTDSDDAFVWFNLADARTLDESTILVANSGSAPLQFFSYGLDPEDSTNFTVIGRFAKSVTYRP